MFDCPYRYLDLKTLDMPDLMTRPTSPSVQNGHFPHCQVFRKPDCSAGIPCGAWQHLFLAPLPPCACPGATSYKPPASKAHWYAVVSDAGATAGIYTDWFTEVRPRVIGAKKTVYHKFRCGGASEPGGGLPVLAPRR